MFALGQKCVFGLLDTGYIWQGLDLLTTEKARAFGGWLKSFQCYRFRQYLLPTLTAMYITLKKVNTVGYGKPRGPGCI